MRDKISFKEGSFKSADSEPLKRQRSTRSTRSTTSSARRRQNESPCVNALRNFLHCYNVLILLVGCGTLGVGIWLLVTDFGARKVTPIVDNQMYEVTTYLLIAGGGFVALLAFCGCCGTVKEDKCVLSFYGTTLAIVLIVLLTACGISFYFRNNLANKIKERMKSTLTNNYGVDMRTNTENRRVTDAWDSMQRQLKCCGVEGDVKSKYSWVYYSRETHWFRNRVNWVSTKRMVPDSCCVPGGDTNICIGETTFLGPPGFHDSHSKDHQQINTNLYTSGCYDELINYLQTFSLVVGIVSAVVPLFLGFGIVISFCLCARVKGFDQDADDV